MADFFSSFIKRSSDTLLRSGLFFVCASGILSWYLCAYRPLRNKHILLSGQTERLVKRIASLKKRLVRAESKEQQLTAIKQKLARATQDLPCNTSEAFSEFLKQIERSGVVLTAWKPGDSKSYQYVAENGVYVEIEGSFSALYALLQYKGLVVYTCCYNKKTQGLLCKGTFSVLSRKRP